MLKKISNVMKKIFGWGVLISLCLSLFIFVEYIIALIIGGDGAVAICKFLKDDVTPMLIYTTSSLVLFALVAMYLGGESALSSKKKVKKSDTPEGEKTNS